MPEENKDTLMNSDESQPEDQAEETTEDENEEEPDFKDEFVKEFTELKDDLEKPEEKDDSEGLEKPEEGEETTEEQKTPGEETEKTEEEKTEEEQTEEAKLPGWVGDLEIEETEIIDDAGVHVDRQCAEEIINWREKGIKPDWAFQKISNMTEEQQGAFKWWQRRNQAFNDVNKEEGGKDSMFTPEGRKVLEEFKGSKEAKALDFLLDKQIAEMEGANKEKVPEEKKKYKDKVALLKKQFDEDEISSEELTTGYSQALDDFETELKSDIKGMVADEVRKGLDSNREDASWNEWEDQCKIEGKELISDPRYRRLALEEVGEDGLTPISRWLGEEFAVNAEGRTVVTKRKVDPRTGKYTTPSTAFELALLLDKSGPKPEGDRINLGDFGGVRPRKTTHHEEEPDFTDEQLADMSISDILKAEFKKNKLTID